MNILKFIGVLSCVLLCLSAQASAGCADREKNEESPISDLYENVRCGLTTQHERLRDSASNVGTSISAGITSVGTTLRDGTTKAFDHLSKAALTTTEFIRDGLNAAIETSKSGFDYVRGVLAPKKLDDLKDAVVGGSNFEVETPVQLRIADDTEILKEIQEKVSDKIIDNVDETLNLI